MQRCRYNLGLRKFPSCRLLEMEGNKGRNTTLDVAFTYTFPLGICNVSLSDGMLQSWLFAPTLYHYSYAPSWSLSTDLNEFGVSLPVSS